MERTRDYSPEYRDHSPDYRDYREYSPARRPYSPGGDRGYYSRVLPKGTYICEKSNFVFFLNRSQETDIENIHPAMDIIHHRNIENTHHQATENIHHQSTENIHH